MDWLAHSFLCVPDDVGRGLEARPLLGISWGFRAEGGTIELRPPAVLGDADWDQHLAELSSRHPVWHFEPGLADLA